MVAGLKNEWSYISIPLLAFMVRFMVKFTSHKTRNIYISETDQSVTSREVVSGIYVGSCKKRRKYCVGITAEI
jgi:hypothetical protein